MARPSLTQIEVLKRFISAHGDKYNYDQVVYKRLDQEVIIVCSIHGTFPQRPSDHWNGHGCKKCGNMVSKKPNVRRTKKLNYEEFVEISQIAHPNMEYGYLNNFVNKSTSMDIYCYKHNGWFDQMPSSHLKGHGCRFCAGKAQINMEEFLRRAKEKHGDRYDYSLVNFRIKTDLIEVVCPEHGVFIPTVGNHLEGHGCGDCVGFGLNLKQEAILYYIKDLETGFYKIGITNHTLKIRFGKEKMKRIKAIKTWKLDTGLEAKELEEFLHEELADFRIINESWAEGPAHGDGKTEFFNTDVLHLDKENIWL